MTTKEHLKNYRQYKALIKHYDQRIAAGVTSEPQALRITREGFARKVSRIERAVAGLTDPTEQHLIRLRYFEGYSWTKVGFALHYSKTSLQRIHARALEHLEQSGVVIEEVSA